MGLVIWRQRASNLAGNFKNLRNNNEGRKIANPAVIATTRWNPVPPTSLPLGKISKKTTYTTVPVAIAEEEEEAKGLELVQLR